MDPWKKSTNGQGIYIHIPGRVYAIFLCMCYVHVSGNRACIFHQILKEGLQNLINVKSGGTQLWIHNRIPQDLALPFNCCVTLGNILNLFVPQFFQLYNGDNSGTYLIGLL